MHLADIFGGGDWRERMEHIDAAMREISRQTDPQELVRVYRARLMEASRMDGFLSLSRRDLEPPYYRIARASSWELAGRETNPWTERDQLPVLSGGILGELMYANEPRLVDDLQVAPDDPAADLMDGMRSLVAIPVYDHGEALNLVIQMRRQPGAFDPDRFPLMVWITNLFARATHNLVISSELEVAHGRLAAEQAAIGELQRSLLPGAPPQIPNLEMAVHSRAAGLAGGDYYDFFPLPDGRWGMLVADVSGHGAHAAVLMAITHAIAHLHRGPTCRPSALLTHLNDHLERRYTFGDGAFVTATYGIFDPETRQLEHAVAGHPPPRVWRADEGRVTAACAETGLALGIVSCHEYTDQVLELRPNDRLLLHTDGMNEARDGQGEFFGVERADAVLGRADLDVEGVVRQLVTDLRSFTAEPGQDDDVTLLVAGVT